MMKKIVFGFLLFALISCDNQSNELKPNAVIPSSSQVEYQQMETIGFIHFTINTFTNKEWGYGDESPELFNPTELDVEQWVKVAKKGGLKELILTAKHHDGFCLWPSKYTEHSIKKSPYKNGQGDLVKEFTEACRKHGLKAGLYLSPWDRNHADYGKPEYIIYYRNQLEELLTQYGEINEIWFDGANGGDGYYGGARETRKIDPKTYYDWDSTFALVKSLQPNISIFSDAGPDIRWIGNEKGFAGETFWSTIHQDELVIGNSDPNYLNSGDPSGNAWIMGQCDVSIRPGWFYHASEDSLVKSPQQLVDIYYKSVGRNAVLLLNLPPDRRGLIHENDEKALKEFKAILDETFAQNLAEKASLSVNNVRGNLTGYAPQQLLDLKPDTYWAVDEEVSTAELVLEWENAIIFDRVVIQEPIQLGQRVSRFEIEVLRDHQWERVFEGTTIGYKRLVRIPEVKTAKVKLRILESNHTIAISGVGFFKASNRENR
jgi:alpha-L-fucosidase